MKWLSGGLTLVSFATVCALLLGMAGGGLSTVSAVISLCLGCVVAFCAHIGTNDTKLAERTAGRKLKPPRKKKEKPLPKDAGPQSYKRIWLWLVGVCFALFALRSFCWLLYIDGDQLRIQSPNNLGDLALHITYIRNFANGVTLWPENPIYTFGAVRYPVGIDLFNALLVMAGIELRHGLIWIGLLASLATFYAFWRWAGCFGIAAFLFNGGVAGFEILHTWKWMDYQGVPSIGWKSVPLAMFVTQRGLLYAIPAGLLLLYQWRAKFFSVAGGVDPGRPKISRTESQPQRGRLQPLPFWVECLLFGSMPLFHVHTFIALSIALGFWFLIGNAATRKQLLLLGACSILPATFFGWLISNHFQAGSVFAWKPGWVQTVDEFAKPFLEFWWVNFGFWLPLILFFGGLCIWRVWQSKDRSILRLPPNLAFLIPAAAIFILTCLIKFAPWEWDNTKVMIWAYFMILPFLWQDWIAGWPEPARVGICVTLFGSGFVSLMGGLAAPGYDFASRTEVDAVSMALQKLPVEARFAAFPTYNHPLLLNGRKVVLGYPGHLWTQGLDYDQINNELTSLMNGAVNWREIAHMLKARYLFWGREERTNYGASTQPWEQSALCVASGGWGAIYDLEPTPATPGPKYTN